MKVIYSPEYGSGWSTWNEDELATDQTLAELITSKQYEEAATYTLNNFKMSHYDFYDLVEKIKGLEVVEVVKSKFIITEYDGFENIEFY